MKKRILILLLILGFMSNPSLVSASSYYQVVLVSMNPDIIEGNTIQFVFEAYEDGDMTDNSPAGGKGDENV